MRLFLALLTACLAVVQIGTAQSDPGFAGLWKFNSARSTVRSMPAPPDQFLKVEQGATRLNIFASSEEGGASTPSTYPLDGTTQKLKVGGSTTSTVTKWEGAALLVNTLVAGPQNYTVMERWTRSRDGNTLTIKRTIVRQGSESESLLIYENPAAVAAAAKQEEPEAAVLRMAERVSQTPDAAPAEYTVRAGTRLLLRLTSAVNTKHAAPGDRVYLETAVPVYVNQRLIIPGGSYVAGTVVDSKRAGRVKGKAELEVRFDTLTLPSGITRDLRSRPSATEGQGNVDRKEGKIEGESNKGGDARTIGETTAAGAGIGSIAGAATGHVGKGLGIGSAAGAAAGLATVLGSRGPDLVLHAGTTVEMRLDRDLQFTDAELRH